MIIVKQGDYILAKVDYEQRDAFKKIVKGAVWDANTRAWRVRATISTFRNLRQFSPDDMAPNKLSPQIRNWYNELITRASRLDALQKGIPETSTEHVAGESVSVYVRHTGRVQGESDGRAAVNGRLPKCVGDTAKASSVEVCGDANAGGGTVYSTGYIGNGGTTPDAKRPIEFPSGFTFHVQPFKHQREAIAFSINIDKSALWLDLGLGKTYTSINLARLRRHINGISKVLVVAPRSLLHQWKQEVNKYAPGEAKVVILEGTPTKKRQALDYITEYDGFLFAVVTYESVGAIRSQLIDCGFDMFILDEATKIKNPKAIRTKAVVEVCKEIKYGVELTGLAYLNNPVDLFSQFLALDETVYGTDQWSFSEHYIDWVKAPFGRMMRGLRNMDELKRRAYFIAFSRSKKDCLDLPDKTYLTRTLPMYDTQKVWYEKLSAEVLEDVVPENLTEVSVTNVLTRLEKLTQVTSGFVIDDEGKTIWFDSPKYAEACDIVQESTESFIIWARHTEALKRMGQALLQRNVISEELSRHTSQHKRNMAIKNFKEGKLRVLICQLDSESRGLDLTCKTNSVNSIYLENSFSIDVRWQSESRQHRIGMKGTATYIDLVLEDTVDEHCLEILMGKYKISEYIAKMGLEIVLGKGGSIVTRKSRSKKKMPEPEDFEEEVKWEDLEGLDGFEDMIALSKRKK